MDTTHIYNLIGRVRKKDNEKKKKTRKQKITRFNPPFNINVAQKYCENVSVIDKHFPKDKRLSKIFNRNTIKVSYSYLPNVKQKISNNNYLLLQLHRKKESIQDSKICNCRQKKTIAHLTASASLKSIVYKATVTETTSNNQETYIGITENKFKTRFNLH